MDNRTVRDDRRREVLQSICRTLELPDAPIFDDATTHAHPQEQVDTTVAAIVERLQEFVSPTRVDEIRRRYSSKIAEVQGATRQRPRGRPRVRGTGGFSIAIGDPGVDEQRLQLLEMYAKTSRVRKFDRQIVAELIKLAVKQAPLSSDAPWSERVLSTFKHGTERAMAASISRGRRTRELRKQKLRRKP